MGPRMKAAGVAGDLRHGAPTAQNIAERDKRQNDQDDPQNGHVTPWNSWMG